MTQTEIDNDKTRKLSFWLLVFPKDVILDNPMFSNHATDVKKENVFMKAPMGSLFLPSMAASWIVAKDYSRDLKKKAPTAVNFDAAFNF